MKHPFQKKNNGDLNWEDLVDAWLNWYQFRARTKAPADSSSIKQKEENEFESYWRLRFTLLAQDFEMTCSSNVSWAKFWDLRNQRHYPEIAEQVASYAVKDVDPLSAYLIYTPDPAEKLVNERYKGAVRESARAHQTACRDWFSALMRSCFPRATDKTTSIQSLIARGLPRTIPEWLP